MGRWKLVAESAKAWELEDPAVLGHGHLDGLLNGMDRSGDQRDPNSP